MNGSPSKLCLALVEGIRYYFCICPRGWWKRWPFLPLPSRKYIEFRLHTAYGMREHGWPRPPFRKIIRDGIRFLLWRRDYRLRSSQLGRDMQ